jgi:hypothetical protein
MFAAKLLSVQSLLKLAHPSRAALMGNDLGVGEHPVAVTVVEMVVSIDGVDEIVAPEFPFDDLPRLYLP